MSRVWVLGAGFSRSLGAPLLPELFSEELHNRVRAAFPSETYPELYSQAASAVRWLHRNFGSGNRAQWRDAEDFLDLLDVAARNPAGATGRWVKALRGEMPGLRAVSAAARRLVAAQCSAFLEDADTSTERWDPYRKWCGDLGSDDYILSFNYDRVLELTSDKVDIVLPSRGGRPLGPGPSVFKLHGSVDWVLAATPDGPRVQRRPDLPNAALVVADDSLVVASPGPTKKETTESLLPDLWSQAVELLRTAGVVVFLGYRFPPSDSAARRVLLDALSANTQAHISLHTVLGADVHHPDSERLKGLLTSSMSRAGRVPDDKVLGVAGVKYYKIKQHPLFAQDFMDVVRFESLK